MKENKTQKFFGDRGFTLFISMLSSFIPLSTDIYLPALPKMVAALNTTQNLINFTLVGFFVFYALGILIWGPLSDKYGRKPILLFGLVIYTIASIACIFSPNVYFLIIARIFQAIGCGAATAVSTAVVKDLYEGHERGKVLAIVQSVGTISPVISPIIGAFILNYTSWRGSFVFLSITGIIGIIGCLFMEETIDEYSDVHVIKTIASLGTVLKIKSFRKLLITFSLKNIAFMSYISESAYIFIDNFGLSEKIYSYFFAFNALFFLLGPILYIRISKHFDYKKIITFSYIMMIISGILMVTIGFKNPWLFAITIIPASLFSTLVNVPTVNLLIEQVKDNIGAASSMMGFMFQIFGIMGMVLISAITFDKVIVMGLMYSVLGVIALILWFVLFNRPYVRHIPFSKGIN